MNIRHLMLKVLVWRIKHISDRNFLIILAGIIGVIAGLCAVALKEATHFIQNMLVRGTEYFNFRLVYLIYPAIGLALTVIISRVVKEKMGHGITDILYSIAQKSSVIRKTKMYSRMITSAITVGFGGSVGLEAPIVVTGSAIGANVGQLMHLDYKMRTLLIGCGSAGAISAIFNSPVAGVIFAVEVILTEVRVTALAPLLIASVGGALISFGLLGDHVLFSFQLTDSLRGVDIPYFIALGLLAGLLSVYFIRASYFTEDLIEKIQGSAGKVVAGGVILGVIILLLPPIYGEGYGSIKTLLAGNGHDLVSFSLLSDSMNESNYTLMLFLLLVILLKPIASAITIGAGGSGGVFAPSLFMGGFLGYLFAFTSNSLLGTDLSTSNFTLVGMSGIMSGVLQAPLTAIFLIAEITSGYTLFVPLMLVSALSFSATNYFENFSLYTKRLSERGEYIAGDKDRLVLSKIQLKRIVEKDISTVPLDASLKELIEVVKRSKRNIFPVLNDEGELKGIITLDDIREIMFDFDQHPSITVKSLMHSPPASIHSDENMQSVMSKFQITGAWNLPVIDNGKYVGFISKSRIFNTYRQKLIRDSRA